MALTGPAAGFFWSIFLSASKVAIRSRGLSAGDGPRGEARPFGELPRGLWGLAAVEIKKTDKIGFYVYDISFVNMMSFHKTCAH